MRIFMFNRKVIQLSLLLFIGEVLFDLVMAYPPLLFLNVAIAVTGGPVAGIILAQYRKEFRGKLIWASKKYREERGV